MQALGEYDFGSYKLVRIVFQAQDLATGAWSNEDPTTVTHEIETPDGVRTVYTYGNGEIVREAVGIYHQALSLNQAHRWRGEWDGTGSVQAPDSWYLTVLPNPFA